MRRQIANAKVLVLALAAGFAASAGGQAWAATTADSVSVAPEPASTTGEIPAPEDRSDPDPLRCIHRPGSASILSQERATRLASEFAASDSAIENDLSRKDLDLAAFVTTPVSTAIRGASRRVDIFVSRLALYTSKGSVAQACWQRGRRRMLACVPSGGRCGMGVTVARRSSLPS